PPPGAVRATGDGPLPVLALVLGVVGLVTGVGLGFLPIDVGPVTLFGVVGATVSLAAVVIAVVALTMGGRGTAVVLGLLAGLVGTVGGLAVGWWQSGDAGEAAAGQQTVDDQRFSELESDFEERSSELSSAADELGSPTTEAS